MDGHDFRLFQANFTHNCSGCSQRIGLDARDVSYKVKEGGVISISGLFVCLIAMIGCIFGKSLHQDYDSFNILFINTGWTKVRNLLSQNSTLLRTKFAFFFLLHCKSPMQCKMHFTDISQTVSPLKSQ